MRDLEKVDTLGILRLAACSAACGSQGFERSWPLHKPSPKLQWPQVFMGVPVGCINRSLIVASLLDEDGEVFRLGNGVL